MIEKYLDLVPSENREKPKFIAWLTSALEPVDSLKNLADEMYTYFDIDNAVGVQLDIAGYIVGVERNLNFQPTVGDPYVSDDDLFRKMIKGKIAKNHWDGTNQDLLDVWESIFDDVVIILDDNQDMTVDIIVIGLGSQIEQELVENGYFVPKAQGVGYNYTFTTNLIFAFDLDNAYFSGFDNGYWI